MPKYPELLSEGVFSPQTRLHISVFIS